jgi:hypothetical protein
VSSGLDTPWGRVDLKEGVEFLNIPVIDKHSRENRLCFKNDKDGTPSK